MLVRKTLNDEEIIREVEALEDNGQKRLILVYGEHPDYSPEYIAHTVKLVYGVKKGHGEIRRVNINAAPLDIEGFRTVGDRVSVPTRYFRRHITLKLIKHGTIWEEKKPITNGVSLLLTGHRKLDWMMLE